MFASFASFAGALTLFMVASVNAQDPMCGGFVSNGTEGTFTVRRIDADTTVLTMFGLNNNGQQFENYILYCGATKPEAIAIAAMGLDPGVKQFKVPLPVPKVLVTGTFTSSYVELAGGQSNIAVLENSTAIVSPCLQALARNKTIVPYDVNNYALQYATVDVGFRENRDAGQVKDVWVPMSIEVAPLLRVEYIKAVSLFFNNGVQASATYNKIVEAYNNVTADMANIPEGNKRHIGWVKYDFSRNTWTLRNTPFTRGIIKDAGGIPFPLVGDGVASNPDISPNDFKILVTNADIIIDQTDFKDDKGTYRSVYSRWLELAGFTGGVNPRVLDLRKVFTLDNTVNLDGVNDYQYRMPSRPDLLLRDLVAAQYPTYDRNYTIRFLNGNFPNDGGPTNKLGPDNCYLDPTATIKFPYNSGDITDAPRNYGFTGLPAPPPVVGGGIYGTGGDSQGSGGSGGGSKTTSIIIAVVCVAAVLGAAFAFAFYKWSRRAKEDRFIELEEEMNNEIPLN